MNNHNNQKQPVNFDNLRALSQINNKDLLRMDKDSVRLRTQIESVSKTIRECLRGKEAEMAKLKREAEKATEVKEVAVASTPAQTQAGEQKRDNSRDFRRKEGNFPRKDGFQRRDGQGQGAKTAVRQFDNQRGRTQDYRQDNRQGARPGQRPGMQSRPGTSPRPGTSARPATTKTTGDSFDKPKFPTTQKRVFDKKKDDRKHDGFDDRTGKSKRSLLRRGILEESNIEERIRGSRRIKSKKSKEQPVVTAAPIDHAIISTPTVTVKQLSEKTGRSVADILKQLMILGIMSNVNSVIDFTTAELVASELGVVLEQKIEKSYEEKLEEQFGVFGNADEGANSVSRPPIVTVLGHVDHGKTSLLDFIRKTHITESEAGGITQHIAAYQIETMGRQITFIDTPGHEAFSAMRARGASVTDIAILVVAGDDGIKPQTKEAIKHIREAKVPMIVAVNKMDKHEANLERVKQQLVEEGVVPEEWGGDAIIVPISALTGMGIDKLLEMVLLVADMQELKADPNRKAFGMVIEAKLDKGKGPIATVIILNGTLQVGDTVISGMHMGKVRALINDVGKNINKALPSVPVSVLGLDGVPNAGDQLYAVDEKMSKNVLAERKRKAQTDKITSKAAFSLEDFLSKSAESEKKVCNVIVKTDVQGSFEALTEILNGISNEEVRVECIHGGVGAINENDVLLAKSADAILIGFNVRPDAKATVLIEQNKVKLMLSKIIYQVIEYIEKTIKSMRAPIFQERVIGHAEVIRIFKISRIGTIAGCIVKDGKITKNSKVRLSRKGEILVETSITTLQKDREDVKEVSAGMECGMKLEGYNDIILEDIIEAFVIEEVERD